MRDRATSAPFLTLVEGSSAAIAAELELDTDEGYD